MRKVSCVYSFFTDIGVYLDILDVMLSYCYLLWQAIV